MRPSDCYPCWLFDGTVADGRAVMARVDGAELVVYGAEALIESEGAPPPLVRLPIGALRIVRPANGAPIIELDDEDDDRSIVDVPAPLIERIERARAALGPAWRNRLGWLFAM